MRTPLRLPVVVVKPKCLYYHWRAGLEYVSHDLTRTVLDDSGNTARHCAPLRIAITLTSLGSSTLYDVQKTLSLLVES